MKKEKAWGGRFTEPTHPLVESFGASIGFDKRLYKHDIRGSIAHATMLAQQKIISIKEGKAIASGLEKIEKEIDAGKFRFDTADEDIHMAIERRLFSLIGDTAGKLHTARSRNDQVATDLRLYLKEAVDEVVGLVRRLQGSLVTQAKENVDTIAPSYTHLQMAQPIRLAHWFLAYFEMLERDVARLVDCRKRIDVMPLGSAALVGTNFPIDRKSVAKTLGFSKISENSLDAVSDRDFVAEFIFDLSLMAVHLSRLSEELIIFTSGEFAVMELPDAFCTGSSIMPQKKNPDMPELARGKTARFIGHLSSILILIKGLPLAYNKDMQEDKEPVFDCHDQMVNLLSIFADMISALKIDKPKLAKRAEEGYMTSVDIADRLVIKGVPFRKAHEIVGRLVRYSIDNDLRFNALDNKELKKIDPLLLKIDISSLNSMSSADGKNVPGGTARKRIVTRLKQVEKGMEKW